MDDGLPKQSIGNYKGVMLCNRPNEFGQQPKTSMNAGKLEPFNSRVVKQEPLGWNPTHKLQPRQTRKKVDPNSILVRHRRYLKQLEGQKEIERQSQEQQLWEKENKMQRFKQHAQKQRDKIKAMKEADSQIVQNPVDIDAAFNEAETKVATLTEANLNKANKALSQMSGKSKATASKKGSKKPAWATTDKQREDAKEAEVDDLLNFAYDLDYEKYMEDFEVRQALAVIKERVNEITQEDDWKEKLADEWNRANEAEQAENAAMARQARDETRSQISQVKTNMTGASKMSYSKRVQEAKAAETRSQPEWNQSVASSKRDRTTEDKVAQQIANEILKENVKLRAVHSGNSIKHLLEREAKKMLALKQDQYKGPVINRIEEKPKRGLDVHNLPYMHKNPAV